MDDCMPSKERERERQRETEMIEKERERALWSLVRSSPGLPGLPSRHCKMSFVTDLYKARGAPRESQGFPGAQEDARLPSKPPRTIEKPLKILTLNDIIRPLRAL